LRHSLLVESFGKGSVSGLAYNPQTCRIFTWDRVGAANAAPSRIADLCDPNVLCLETFRSLLDFELDGLAFLKAAKSIAFDLGVMDEDVP
jgi:hypothetical protein